MRIRLMLVLILLSSVIFAGGLNFSAIGRDGIAYYTVDSGETWQVGNSNTSEYINAVATDRYGNFWAVGADGMVLRSEDYGASYENVHNLTKEIFNAIDIDDQGRFVVVGSTGSIFASYDGGITFKNIGPDTDINLLDVNIDNPKLWIVVGIRGMILTSENKGKTWVVIEKVSGSSYFNAITYTKKGIYIIAGTRGAVFNSKDGKIWKPRVFAEGFKGVIEGLASDSNGDVYAVGWSGIVFRSSDEGNTWTKVETGDDERLTAIAVLNGKIVLVGFSSAILTNNENSWTIHDKLGRRHLIGVASNYLPDLTITLKRTEGCQIEITVSNKGPGRLTDKPYRDKLVGVHIYSDNKSVYTISLAELDPDKKLKNKDTELKHKVGIKMTKDVKASWSLNGIVKDYDMANNNATIHECVIEK
ncbi:MAG: hypothetical protein ABUK01_10530 [Leptospirales bacterium]